MSSNFIHNLGTTSESSDLNDTLDSIIESGAFTIKYKNHIVYCMTVIGQIEGHYILPQNTKTTKYEHVIPQLIMCECSEHIEGVVLLFNTVGGDIEAGLALSEMIKGLQKPTVSLILGGGHSIGIPLAVSTDKSFIVPSATMMVHPVRSNGLVIGVPQTLDYFLKIQERIVNFVSDNSMIDKDEFRDMMTKSGELVTDLGTILDGKKAVNCGLIDKLGYLRDALDELVTLIENRKEEI